MTLVSWQRGHQPRLLLLLVTIGSVPLSIICLVVVLIDLLNEGTGGVLVDVVAVVVLVESREAGVFWQRGHHLVPLLTIGSVPLSTVCFLVRLLSLSLLSILLCEVPPESEH